MRLLLVFAAALACAEDRRVAITIDDLPVAQSGADACAPAALMDATKRLLSQFAGLPITTFVIGRNCPDLTPGQRRAALRLWMDAGAEMGNHSFSHRDYNGMPAAEYAADVARGEASLREGTGLKKIRYFRSPMLHTGRTKEDKQHLERFLAEKGWQQAPVTFDNSDWMFANLYAHALRTGDKALERRVREGYVPYMESVVAFFENRTVDVVGRDIPHVLLIHANHLNRDLGGELVKMFRRRGYKFISLEEALRDDAYRLPNEYAGPGGFSWLHRWSITKGMPNKGEPEEPKWVREKFEEISRR